MSDFEYIVNSIEKNHIVNLLDSDRRLDGRRKNDIRDIKIETNIIDKANGSAIVQIGQTKVIAGVKAQFGTPWSDQPKKGSLFIGFETTPLSAPEYRAGPPQPDAIELARVTDRLIRESGVVDLEKLCIIEGEKVWQLNIDIYALDDFGNLFDAAALGAFAALATTKLPDIQIVDGEVEKLETSSPLGLTNFPISITTYKINEELLVDAELREEQISDARITFGLTEDHIVSGQKGGSGAFKSEEIIDILRNSIKLASEVRAKVSEQIPDLTFAGE
ncbi:MAG: exosome complex protein Rrp42 [Candidatus Kariarchaeaceae archaeon]|jgi:exosome complex component RRP42